MDQETTETIFEAMMIRLKQICATSCAVLLMASLGTTNVASQTISPCALDPVNCSLDLRYNDGQGGTMPYRLFSPPDPVAGETYPLVIFLHGAGLVGTDNTSHIVSNVIGLIDATQSEPYSSFLVAPQLPSTPWDQDRSVDFTREIIDDVIRNYPVDTDRLYVTGLSAGGFGTTRLVDDNPEIFAAAMPIAGASFINGNQAARIADVPFWLFHGDEDPVVSVSRSRNFVAALEAAGGSPRYDEIASTRHNVWDEVYFDHILQRRGVYDWLFSQSLATAIPEPGTGFMLGFLTMSTILRRRAMRRR